MKWLLAVLALVYVLVPWDLLPDFLAGLGWLDDLLLAGLVWYFFFRSNEGPTGRTGPGSNSGSARTNQQSQQKTANDPGDAQTARDPYRILELQPGAGQAEIRAAYRRLAARYHPDKVAHLGEDFQALAEKKFKAIQAAYDILRQNR
jgi:hypothetical protein